MSRERGATGGANRAWRAAGISRLVMLLDECPYNEHPNEALRQLRNEVLPLGNPATRSPPVTPGAISGSCRRHSSCSCWPPKRTRRSLPRSVSRRADSPAAVDCRSRRAGGRVGNAFDSRHRALRSGARFRRCGSAVPGRAAEILRHRTSDLSRPRTCRMERTGGRHGTLARRLLSTYDGDVPVSSSSWGVRVIDLCMMCLES